MRRNGLLLLLTALMVLGTALLSCKDNPAGKDNAAEEKPSSDSLGNPPRVLPDSTASLEVLKTEGRPRFVKQGYYIIIDKARYRLHFYKDGTLIKSYPVAVGKTTGDKLQVGDSATPEGHFFVKAIRDASAWTYDFNDGKGEIPRVYGPWFISLETGRSETFTREGWSGIGIHGTHDPSSIGKNITAGCIRMHNKDVDELKKELEKEPDLSKINVDIISSL